MQLSTLRLVGAIALAPAMLAAPAAASDDISVSADVAVNSAYYWRGFAVNDEPVFQPAISVARGGFSVGVWGNSDITNRFEQSGEFTEVDFTLAYGTSTPVFDLSAGVIEYMFPQAGGSAREIFASAATSKLPVSLSLDLFYGVNNADGLYASAGAGWGMPLAPTASLSFGAAVGFATSAYQETYYGLDSGALSDAQISAGVDFSLPNGTTISPALTFTTVLDSDAADVLDGMDLNADQVTFGINANVPF